MCGVDEDLERERETKNALSSKSSPLWLATWVEIGLKLCGSFLGFIWRATAAASRPSILRVKMNQQFLLCVYYTGSTNSMQLSENVKLESVEKRRQAGKKKKQNKRDILLLHVCIRSVDVLGIFWHDPMSCV
jgi:hypothetical protein